MRSKAYKNNTQTISELKDGTILIISKIEVQLCQMSIKTNWMCYQKQNLHNLQKPLQC